MRRQPRRHAYLRPPLGLSVYFASAMFNKNIRYVAASVLPALDTIVVGTLLIALLQVLSTGLQQWGLEMKLRDWRFSRAGAPCWSTQSFQLKYRLLGVAVDTADSLTC